MTGEINQTDDITSGEGLVQESYSPETTLTESQLIKMGDLLGFKDDPDAALHVFVNIKLAIGSSGIDSELANEALLDIAGQVDRSYLINEARQLGNEGVEVYRGRGDIFEESLGGKITKVQGERMQPILLDLFRSHIIRETQIRMEQAIGIRDRQSFYETVEAPKVVDDSGNDTSNQAFA